MYRQLDAARIHETLEELRDRIVARFPESGLSKVSVEMLALSREVGGCAMTLRLPIWPVRAASAVSIVTMVMLLLYLIFSAPARARFDGIPDVFQAIEAGINTVLLFGAASLFLWSLEARIKRARALRLIHQLRSLAHVVDMHQLTKDPERLMSPPATGAQRRVTTGPDLARYLDYCSELLSVVSKLAALLVQHFDDATVLSAVTEIENLTTGLSGKIWQKISLLERAADE